MKFLLFLLGLLGLVILGSLVFLFQLLRKPFRGESLGDYFYALAVGFDQLGGSIIYGLEDWCISSVAYYHAEQNKNVWFMKFINFLFRDDEHCKKSYENEYRKLGFKPFE